MKLVVFALAMLAAPAASSPAPGTSSTTYLRAPDPVRKVLDARLPPAMFPSPTGDRVLLARALRYPPVAELAEPMLKLAGVRLHPHNNARQGDGHWVELALQPVPDGPARTVTLPKDARVGTLRWNAIGTKVAFTNVTPTGVELWVLDVKTAKTRRISNVKLNGVLGDPIAWLADQQSLLVRTVVKRRPAPPVPKRAPPGPRIEESKSVASASSTYEARDLLRTPHEADLFEYYATSQLALVDVRSGSVKPIGSPGVFDTAAPAPDGKHVLVQRIERPYSYTRPYHRFPAKVEVWDRRGKLVERVADLPLADQVPIQGVRTGPRDHHWRATAAATLVWSEALDGGDTFKKVPEHDRVLTKPIGAAATELLRTKQRFAGLQWIEGGNSALVSEVDQDKHRVVVRLIDVDKPANGRVVWDRNYDDRYGDPGSPIYRTLPTGARVIREQQGAIFLAGAGATPGGNRPFLDRLELDSLKTERLFRSKKDELEWFSGWTDDTGKTFMTRRESPSEPPNLFVRTLAGPVSGAAAGEAMVASTAKAITSFDDPTPQLRKITKKLVTYKRKDGVPLSFTMYLPPGYPGPASARGGEGMRLPTIVWAYPLDYTDPSAAGQVRGSPNEFTTIVGASPVFLALAGYVVLDDVAMPVVGPAETAYDTFVEQITQNAVAAIDKAVELGVTDRERVGVMGHSHGALMTANLLVYTDLFRAGVARSGAYNHTLRPFGFQNERRTFYKARSSYMKLSPVLHADELDEPILIIHGEIDANPGTTPQQSEKLFEAVRGVGGTTRLVMLPFESHGYVARESTEHAIAETIAWFDRYVKNAAPRAKKQKTRKTQKKPASKSKAKTTVPRK
jgi:dipeptidyl aminopeptidase/acylaminoacyl peptidase